MRTRAGSDKRFLVERGPVDAVLALALVHHLAISNNVPLADVASFPAEPTGWLIIELVSKEDEQGSDCWHPARISSRTTTKLGSSTPMSRRAHSNRRKPTNAVLAAFSVIAIPEFR